MYAHTAFSLSYTHFAIDRKILFRMISMPFPICIQLAKHESSRKLLKLKSSDNHISEASEAQQPSLPDFSLPGEKEVQEISQSAQHLSYEGECVESAAAKGRLSAAVE